MIRQTTLAFTLLSVSVVTSFAEQNDSPQTQVRLAVGRQVSTISSPPAPATGIGPSQPPAIVDTSIRPRRARLFLDNRLIGLATDFDGSPDFLFLQTGVYRLRVELGGYVSETVLIDANSGYRYDLAFRLERQDGVAREPWWRRQERPKHPQRFYSPITAPVPSSARQPNPQLRERDYARSELKSATKPSKRSSLHLEVSPDNARVFIDGGFLGTGRELASLTQPIAIAAGVHDIEAAAPGRAPSKQRISLKAGEKMSLRIDLQPEE
ncbi:MAG: hypothetical protein GY906_07055 [bacterium]|nr:hypothetical protein [bacterium]